MQDYFLESLKLQRIDFFIKLVAAMNVTMKKSSGYPVGL